MQVPRYVAIAQEIEDTILPAIEDGGKLPSTAMLAERFDVNRHTVRQGLDLLARKGKITASQGQGTFKHKRSRRYVVRTGHTASLSEQMAREGRTVENHVRGTDLDESPPRFVSFPSSVRIDTFRTVDGAAWSLTRTWFNPELFPDIVDRWPGTGSLGTVMSEHYGRTMVRAERSFDAVRASAEACEYLGIAIGEPALRVRGSNVDAVSGEILVYVEHLFPGENVEFSMRFQ